MHPHDVRVAARAATYPNRQTETANLARVDGEVFDRVRVLETQIADTAQRFMDDHAVDVAAAGQLVVRLRETVLNPIADGRNFDQSFVRAWDILRLDMERAIAALDRASAEAPWHLSRCSDPYSAYCQTMTKFPMLHPGIAIQ
jgi:hypothetical protein